MLRARFTSLGTSGSAFSFTVTAAVVCGTKTTQIPSFTPEAATAFCTSPVMLIQSVCPPVRMLKSESVVIGFENKMAGLKCQGYENNSVVCRLAFYEFSAGTLEARCQTPAKFQAVSQSLISFATFSNSP